MTTITHTAIQRKFLRIPLAETSEVNITIGGKPYQVFNVASSGVGICLDKADTFIPGDKLTDVVLTIDKVPCQVIGSISHVSRNHVHYLCGIELLDMTPETGKLLQRFVDNNKASLFSLIPE